MMCFYKYFKNLYAAVTPTVKLSKNANPEGTRMMWYDCHPELRNVRIAVKH